MSTSKYLFGIAGLTLFAAPALANSGDLLSCYDRGSVRQRCELKSPKLADGLVEDGVPYEAQFLVRYDFPCSGHSVQLGIKAGDATKMFTQGTSRALITVNGNGELRPYDPAPETTRRLTFWGGCKLDVTDVTVLPSIWTVQLWSDQAKQEAKVLDLSVKLYLLAKDHQNLSTWNVEKLQLLKDKLEKLVGAVPTNLNYKVMLNSVNSALENQPPSATLDEIGLAGADVMQTLRGELEAEVATAQHLLDRFTNWALAADKELQGALDNAHNV